MTYTIFGAPWCANCNTTKDQLKAMGVKFDYIDIDEKRELAVENNIRSLPTLITESGERAVGLLKILELVKSQNEHLPSNPAGV